MEASKFIIGEKAITEFAHERIITPAITEELEGGWKSYQLTADQHDIVYAFKAKHLSLNQLMIAESSLKKTVNGEDKTVDAVEFIKNLEGF